MKKAPVNRVRFRLDRVEPAWREIIEIVREASDERDDCGPELALPLGTLRSIERQSGVRLRP